VLLAGERLLLTAGFRAERSSIVGNTGKYNLFPKFAGSYRFPGLLGQGSDVKLRAAYGETGNLPFFSQKFTPFATGTIGGQVGTTIARGQSGAADIKPERLREFEGGIDASLAEGRATFELTAFTRSTKDLLLEVAPAGSSGYTSFITNAASMRNQGLEATLGLQPVQSRNFSWLVRSTFTMFRNKVTSLPVPSYRPNNAGFGLAYGEFIVVPNYPVDLLIGSVVQPDGSTIVDTIGRASPDFRLSLGNDISIGKLSFSMLWDWQQGGWAQNQTLSLYDCNNLAPDGNTAAGQARNAACVSSFPSALPFVERTTFLKLREVTLGLVLPRSIASVFRAGDARLTLSGRNLLLFTPYTGYDPEVSNYGQQAVTRNIDLGAYPPSRSFFLSLTLGY
jgi:outer membrane receptor protein involved in Fe transport